MLPQSGLSPGSKIKALKEAGIDVPLKLYSGLDGNQTLEIIAPDLDETVRKLVLAAQAKRNQIPPHRGATVFGRSTASAHSARQSLDGVTAGTTCPDHPLRVTQGGHRLAQFAEMRSRGGPTGILVYCADYRCSHSIAMSADVHLCTLVLKSYGW